MNLLIPDPLITPANERRRILDHASIAVAGDRILALGDAADLERAHPDFERMSGRGLAVLPGFVNAHTHTLLLALRGTIEDWEGNERIYRYMTPISYAMTAEDRAVLAALGCLEAIRSGTTTLVDPFRSVCEYAGAMADSGLRLWLSESSADIDTRKIRHGDYSVDPAFGRMFLDRTQALVETWNGARNGRIRCQIAAHAPDNCSPAMLANLRDLAEKYGLTRTVHLSQSPGEVATVRKTYGLTSAEYLDREGFLGPDLTAAHWTFCTPSDIALLAERGVSMVNFPASSSRAAASRPGRPDPRRGVAHRPSHRHMSEDMFPGHGLRRHAAHRTGAAGAVEGGASPTGNRFVYP